MVVISSPFSGSVSPSWPISIFVAPIYGEVSSSISISIARAVAPAVPSLWAAGSAVTAPIIPPGSLIAIILSARPTG
jgi:hypothetical protein